MEALQEKKGGKWHWLYRTWRVVRFLSLTLITLVFLLVLLVFLFEDKIKRYAVEQFNQYLTTRVEVESIDLSLFSKFPYASLEFTNILIKDPEGTARLRDTLLQADKLYLEFSIWDMIAGNYDVTRIEIEHADARVFVDKNGKENYDIWKDDGSEGDGKFDFELEKVILHDSRLSYVDKRSGQDHTIDAEELFLSGKFTESVFDLQTGFTGRIDHITSNNISFIRDKAATMDIVLKVDQQNDQLSFQTGLLSLGKMNFDVGGKIMNNDSCHLHFKGRDIDIKSLLATFPSLLGEDLEQYQTSGKLEFTASLDGPFDALDIRSDFDIGNARLSERKSGVTLENLNFKGNFRSKRGTGNEVLTIDALSGNFRDGTFSGNLKLKGLSAPKIDARLKGQFNLLTLQQFFRFKEVKEAKGNLNLQANVNGQFLFHEESESWSMDISKASGMAEVQGLTLHMTEQHNAYRDFNGKFVLSNNNAVVEDLTGNIGKSDIALSGVLQNLLPYILLKEQKLNILANFRSKEMDLDDLLASDAVPEKPQQQSNASEMRFPSDINFNLDASVDKIKYSTFKASRIAGNFKLLDKVFQANHLSMVFAHGLCTGDLEIDGTNNETFAVSSNVNIDEMDISELFVLFKDFGQDIIRPEHLKGILTARVAFGMAMDKYLNVDQDKIVSNVQLKLINGELKNLKQLTDIADYMRTDKKIKAALKENIDDLEKRLRHIKFSEITNTIFIRNGKIEIPDMDVLTSALNINLWATHGFDNSIDYHLNFRYLELKAQNSETEYGTIIDDGLGYRIYIHMFGNIDNPKFESDTEERKKDRKAYNEAEKENMKAILQKEFGLFKKDTTLKIKETPEQEVKFLMEWDNGSSTTPTDTEKTKEEDKQKKEEERKKKEKERMERMKKKLGVEEEKSGTGFEVE